MGTAPFHMLATVTCAVVNIGMYIDFKPMTIHQGVVELEQTVVLLLKNLCTDFHSSYANSHSQQCRMLASIDCFLIPYNDWTI